MENNLRHYLDKIINSDYTIDDFIKDAEVGRTSVFEIARGKQIPKIDTAVRIAKAVKAPVEDVFPILREGANYDAKKDC